MSDCQTCEQKMAEATALASALRECAEVLSKEVGHGYIWQRADRLLDALDIETKVVLHVRRAVRQWGSLLSLEGEEPASYEPPRTAEGCSCPCHTGAKTTGRCCLHRPVYASELGEKAT